MTMMNDDIITSSETEMSSETNNEAIAENTANTNIEPKKDMENDTDNKVRELWKRSGLSYVEFAKATNIKYNTIAVWISGRRKPTEQKFLYMVYAIDNYNRRNKCNGDVIRNMTNEELVVFLNELVHCTFPEIINETDLRKKKIPDKYRDFLKYVNDTDLVSEHTVKKFYKDYMDVDFTNIEDFAEWTKAIIFNTDISLTDMAKITKISKNNIINWAYKGFKPTNEIVTYIKDTIQKHVYICRNNGDIIRRMDNEELAKLLDNIFTSYLHAEGRRSSLPPKFRDLKAFVEKKSMVTFKLDHKRDYKFSKDKEKDKDKDKDKDKGKEEK